MTQTMVQTESEHGGAVLRVVLDAPPGNLLDLEMIDGLRNALARAAREPGLKALVLEGAGAHFSYGTSLSQHRPGEIERLLPRFHDLLRDLYDLARPTLAVVRGKCLGSGLELAAFCNWIFAAPDAVLGQPEIRFGLYAPAGSLWLVERIGRAPAEKLCLGGHPLQAEEALETGLVDHVAEEPAAAAAAWIERTLLPQSAAALHHALRAMRLPLRDGFLRDLDEVERMYLRELMRTEDAREGITAFLEKRPPVWKNR